MAFKIISAMMANSCFVRDFTDKSLHCLGITKYIMD